MGLTGTEVAFHKHILNIYSLDREGLYPVPADIGGML